MGPNGERGDDLPERCEHADHQADRRATRPRLPPGLIEEHKPARYELTSQSPIHDCDGFGLAVQSDGDAVHPSQSRNDHRTRREAPAERSDGSFAWLSRCTAVTTPRSRCSSNPTTLTTTGYALAIPSEVSVLVPVSPTPGIGHRESSRRLADR